jgi:hypothetical protein
MMTTVYTAVGKLTEVAGPCNGIYIPWHKWARNHISWIYSFRVCSPRILIKIWHDL